MGKSFTQKPLPGGRFLLRGPGGLVLRVDPSSSSALEIRKLCSVCEADAVKGKERLRGCDECYGLSGSLGSPHVMSTLEDWLTDACENPLTASILLSDLRLKLKHLQASHSMILKVQAKKAGRSARKARKTQARFSGNFTADARAAQRQNTWAARRDAWLAERGM